MRKINLINRKAKKVLNVYSEHIGRQEAENYQIKSLLKDYRNKFGPLLELSHGSEIKKADLERQLQEIRKKIKIEQIQIKTEQSTVQEQNLTLKQMDDVLDSLTNQSENVDEDIIPLQEEFKNLQNQSQEIDEKIRILEDELQNIMTTRPL